MRRIWPLFALLAVVFPLGSSASEPVRAGVVTTLLGSATIVRANAPEPAPLKFRDPVFLNDRVSTAENSLARILLGGKALVTVRERSMLHVTELPGASTVELGEGRIALAVVKERMKPGELIEIRTPNAVAGIRGTIVIAEHAGGVSTFVVLRGQISVANLNPATRQVIGQHVLVNVNERISVQPNVPLTPQRLAPEAAEQIASDYHVATSGAKVVDTAVGTPGSGDRGLDTRGGPGDHGGRARTPPPAITPVVPGAVIPSAPGGSGSSESGGQRTIPRPTAVTQPPISLPQDKSDRGKVEVPDLGHRGGSGRK